MKKYFENRTCGFYLTLISAGVALVSGILYFVLDGSDIGRTFSWLAFALMLAGTLSEASVLFTRVRFASLIPTAFYIAGFAIALRATLPSVSDLWNNVNFIGGNAYLGMTFTALFLLSAILNTVANFFGMEQSKEA